MKKNPFIGNIILGILIAVSGVVVLSNQGLFVKIIVIVAGIYSLITGFYTLFNIRSLHFEKNTKLFAIIKSIIAIIIGVIAIIAPITFASVYMGTLQIFIAVALCFQAGVAIQNAIMCKKIDKRINVSSFAWEALIDVVLAFIFFMHPDKALPAVVIAIGVAGIVLGVACLAMGIIGAVRYRKLADAVDEAVNK